MNFLSKIDDYFYNKPSKKEFQYTILLIVFLIGFIFYYYIFPIAENYKIKNEKRYKNLVSMVESRKREINLLKSQVIRANKDIKILNKQLITLKKDSMFFDELTSLMDFAEFNRLKWANLVKNIILDAKSDGLEVKFMGNELFDDKNQSAIIDKKMNINLSLKGDYINFIYLIYSYENRKDLIRVENIDINGSNKYFIKFSVYGYGK